MFTDSHAAPRRRPIIAFCAVVVLVLVVVLAVSSEYVGAAEPARPAPAATVGAGENAGQTASMADVALATARDLSGGRAGRGHLSDGLADELGYVPALEGGLSAAPDGDCSSPVPLPDRFESACRVHDLGYDLLRVAHRNGVAIPEGLRSDLDTLMGELMRESCDGEAHCLAAADVARVAVNLNTLRQGHGAPVEESFPW